MDYSRLGVYKKIDNLFTKAKNKDEFEYCCALLRFRGLEDSGWDPFVETNYLYQDILALTQAPLQILTRVRLVLLLYCHLTEVDAMYEMLFNMINISTGERYQAFPFIELYSGKTRQGTPPSAKRVVQKLLSFARENSEQEIQSLISWMFNDSIRNAFFHSDYTLHNNEFRSSEGYFETQPNHFDQAIKFEQLENIVNRGIIFYSEFIKVLSKHKKSYKSNKKIKGRFASDGSVIDVELLANQKTGLFGFKG